MSYNRGRKANTNLRPLGEHVNVWLATVAEAIASKSAELNHHMKAQVENKRWYRVNVDTEGESLSDIPAGGYTMIEYEKGMISARCTYTESGMGSRDAKFDLKIDDDPDKFILYIAKFITGVN
jgi:hypothetical protein